MSYSYSIKNSIKKHCKHRNYTKTSYSKRKNCISITTKDVIDNEDESIYDFVIIDNCETKTSTIPSTIPDNKFINTSLPIKYIRDNSWSLGAACGHIICPTYGVGSLIGGVVGSIIIRYITSPSNENDNDT